MKTVHNPFRRMEEEVIDIDDTLDGQPDSARINYNDYGSNDYEPTQRSQGFTMSENKAQSKPK